MARAVAADLAVAEAESAIAFSRHTIIPCSKTACRQMMAGRLYTCVTVLACHGGEEHDELPTEVYRSRVHVGHVHK